MIDDEEEAILSISIVVSNPLAMMSNTKSL
jgi:hypothetical protein